MGQSRFITKTFQLNEHRLAMGIPRGFSFHPLRIALLTSSMFSQPPCRSLQFKLALLGLPFRPRPLNFVMRMGG